MRLFLSSEIRLFLLNCGGGCPRCDLVHGHSGSPAPKQRHSHALPLTRLGPRLHAGPRSAALPTHPDGAGPGPSRVAASRPIYRKRRVESVFPFSPGTLGLEARRAAWRLRLAQRERPLQYWPLPLIDMVIRCRVGGPQVLRQVPQWSATGTGLGSLPCYQAAAGGKEACAGVPRSLRARAPRGWSSAGAAGAGPGRGHGKRG